jgi:DNA repair photolyase
MIKRLIDDSICGIFDKTDEEKLLSRKTFRSQIAIGFTLTGYDELEPNASTNAERIEAMAKLHHAGFKTFASIEPIIDFKSSQNMILISSPFCDLYKIGLESGKTYDRIKLKTFVQETNYFLSVTKIYFKDSLLKAAGINRSELPANCVDRDYNIFKQYNPISEDSRKQVE